MIEVRFKGVNLRNCNSGFYISIAGLVPKVKKSSQVKVMTCGFSPKLNPNEISGPGTRPKYINISRHLIGTKKNIYWISC